MDLSQIPTEELMKMRAGPQGPDLSSISTEELMKMRGADQPDPTGTFTENLAAGSGKAIVDTARGLEQIGPILERGVPLPARPFLMAGRKVREMITGRSPEVVQAEIDEAKKLDAPLMDTGGGMTGNIATQAALYAALPAANTARGAATVGAAIGATQPVAEGESRVKNIVVSGGAAGGTQAVLGKATTALQNRAANKAAQAADDQAYNAVRDQVLAQSQAAGYKVPPATVNPSLAAKAVESAGGKIHTEQAFSASNQKVTDTLAREGLGLRKGDLLTEGKLADMRKQAGKAYEAIKTLELPPTGGKMWADDAFRAEVQGIGEDIAVAAKEFPESTSNAAIDKLTRDLAAGAWTPKAIIEKVKMLRSDATANFKAFNDPERLALARAQRKAAEALDGLVERKLAEIPEYAALSGAYKNARQLIAKTHDVEAALTGQGHVDARVLAKFSDRLTGPLKTIADFAENFPKAAAAPEKVGSAGITTLRSAIGAGIGTVLGGPVGAMVGGAAGVAVPWTVRQMILSGPGQKLLASPSYSAGGRRIADLLANPMTRAALPAGAAGVALQDRP